MKKVFPISISSFILMMILLLFVLDFIFFSNFIITITPKDLSINLEQEDYKDVTFSISSINPVSCDINCTYKFIGDEKVLDRGEIILSNNKIEKNYTLDAPSLGKGQNLYSFNAKCTLVKSGLCFIDVSPREKTTLVTLNYDLPETKEALKKHTKTLLMDYYDEFISVQERYTYLGLLLDELDGKLYLNQTKEKFSKVSERYSAHYNSFIFMTDLWNLERYNDLMLDENISIETNEIREQIIDLQTEINYTLNQHNKIIQELTNTTNELEKLSAFVDVSELTEKWDSLQEEFAAIEYDIFEQIQKEFLNEIEKEKVLAIVKNIDRITQINKIIDETQFILCKWENICIPETKDTNFTYSLDQNYVYLDRVCKDIFYLNNSYDFTYDSDLIESEKNDYENKYIENYNEMVRKLNNRALSINSLNVKNDDDYCYVLESTYNTALSLTTKKYLIDIMSSRCPQLKNISIMRTLPQTYVMKANLSKNVSLGFPEKLIGFNCSLRPIKEIVIEPEPVYFDITLDATFPRLNLTEIQPVCCVLGRCTICCNDDECKYDPYSYPIVLLHGHLFNSRNDPDISLASFNKIQNRLHEDGFINAGTVLPSSRYSEVSEGEWGRIGLPVSIKTSYYYEDYNENDLNKVTENITTYAHRLNSMIELIKFRTGKPKVNIIAHSMGGLVAREYLDLYGEDSVYKLIMLGTPNFGIDGKAKDLCPVFGSNKECKDMTIGSKFLKKLNEEPEHTQMYVIYGSGCDMKGIDGDGVVYAHNTQLSYAKNIEISGECESLFSTLHVKLTDIEEKPIIYDIIRNILKN